MIKTFSLLSVICFMSLSTADVVQRPISRTSSEEERARQMFVQCRQASNEGTYSTASEVIAAFNYQWNNMTPQQKAAAINRDQKKPNSR